MTSKIPILQIFKVFLSAPATKRCITTLMAIAETLEFLLNTKLLKKSLFFTQYLSIYCNVAESSEWPDQLYTLC